MTTSYDLTDRSARSSAGLRGASLLALCLLAHAGQAQEPLQGFEGPFAGGGAGASVALLGDLDGDGTADVLVGAPGDDQAGADAGAVRVLSGADGSLLFERQGYGPGDQLGSAVANAGDVDADGLDDLIVAAAQDAAGDGFWPSTGPGYVLVLSGADGSLLHSFRGGYDLTPDFNGFGRRVAGAGDVDGDGHADIAVAEREGEVDGPFDMTRYGGRVWIYSGADGSVLRRLQDASLGFGHLGWGLDAGTDVDGDGVPDVVAGAPLEDRVVLFSGATGLPLVQAGGSVNFLGNDVAFIDDQDGDGRPDLAAGGKSLVQALSGATGFPIWSAIMPGAPVYDGARVAAVPDLDGDGRGDVVAGVPDASGVADQGGKLIAIGSASRRVVMVVQSTADGALLGSDVVGVPDLDGDGFGDLLIGAPGADGGAGAGAGLAGLWSTRGPRLRQTLYSSYGFDIDFGQRVAAVGDVDNDGVGDLAVGLPNDGTSFPSGGKVEVYSGADASLLHSFVPPDKLYRLGWSVDGVGDVDGDGHADIAAGAPYPTALVGPPYVDVWSGRTGALLQHLTGPLGSQFGTTVLGVGDLDGDGRGDLAVAAPNDSSSGSAIGNVRVFSGASGALLFVVPGQISNSQFGGALAMAGDVDADGTPDLLIGARTAITANGGGSGLVRVASGVDGSTLHEFLGPVPLASAGWAVAGLGDVDGDGHADIAYGVPGVPSAAGTGLVLVRSGDDGSLLHALSSTDADGSFGQALARVGDLDGDGVSDLAVGLPNADDAATSAGAVRFYSGADGALISSWPGPVGDAQAGFAIASRDDLDNDGSRDLVVGAATSPESPTAAGAVHVVNPLPVATPWRSLGGALTGAAGTPRLLGGGSLETGEIATLALTDARPDTVSALVFGTFELSLPFKGGVLVPDPFLIIYGLPTGPDGELTINAPWSGGVPSGFEILAQHWISDAAGPVGFAASNGVLGTVP